MIWYKQNVDELFEILETNDQGLSSTEAHSRLDRWGPNQLAIKKEPLWRVLVEPFRSVFVAVLGVAAVVSLLSREPLDAVIIGSVIFIDTTVYYSQRYATNRVLRSLKKHDKQNVTALRNKEQAVLSSTELVPGDIIFLEEGERVPADARVIHDDNLRVDESSLTGESTPVHKNASTLDSHKQIYEQDNMLFQGTFVTSGSARAVVIETGNRTEYGKIAELATGDKTKSPVQVKIDNLIALLVKCIGGASAIVFLLALIRGIPAGEALRFVLSLSVSVVPEGLPVALTVIIVLGMRRMAKQKALVRSFKAIEDIGLITTIATDKTGTLTKNRLKVVDSWTVEKTDIKEVAALTLNLSSKKTDPLDTAISEFSGKTHEPHLDKLYPFDLSLRMSGGYVKADKTLYVKGAPEHILANSKLNKAEHHEAELNLHKFASQGYRVIAIGRLSCESKPPENLSHAAKGKITFIGFLALADELREEAPHAIRLAREAGISVRLITGDHFETAYNIGKKIGLAEHTSQVIQGVDLPKDQRSLAVEISKKTIFARILPEDKFRILKALKETEITAMTGDGVNDVPALSNAHVGIAMGSGSDIARDAGGIILLNDNFATIVKAIGEGRKIFDNIRRMLFYLLSTSLGEILTMIGALIFALPLPVTAIQILWINLVTDTAMVLPLGLEPEEEGIMKRPPRRPKEPLLNKLLLSRMFVISLTMALVTLLIVYILHRGGKDTAYIQTVAFMTLIAAQWMNAFNARSEQKSSFSRIKHTNYGLLFGFLVAFGAQLLVMFGPLKSVFGIQQVPISVLVMTSSVIATLILAVSELHKFITRAAHGYPSNQ